MSIDIKAPAEETPSNSDAEFGTVSLSMANMEALQKGGTIRIKSGRCRIGVKLDESALDHDPVATCVAAIHFALQDEDGMLFLKYWNEGDLDTIRKEWPDAPQAVFNI